MALTDNLVSYYKLDGNSNDAKGSNNGSDTDITYSTGNGKINQGAGFNASTSKIDLGDVFKFTSSFSISGWYKSSTTGTYKILSAKQNNSTGKYYWALYASTNSNYPYFILWNTLAGAYMQAQCTINVCDNKWHHIIAVYDSSVPSVQLFIDGIAQTASTTTSGTWNTNPSPMPNAYIGGETVQSADGAIDEVGFWNRTLSSQEVQQLFNFGNANQYSFPQPFNVF